jgi:4-amino-4-deoxy-L-arabinose transferase-like glycosyltransferase
LAPWVIAIFCFSLQIAGTWALPLMDRDEPRFAEASREMRENGDYIVPQFNHQWRLDKPPLIYWCQAAAYRLFGENEFAARLPSSLASALTALIVFGFASRVYNRQIGLNAALVFSLCPQVLLQSKAGVADMCLVLFVAHASWAGWELITSRSSRPFWWWTFYAALAFGFLAKGPVAWLPIGTILIHARWTRQAGINRMLKFHFGIPVMLVLIALWGVPTLLQTHGDFLRVGIGHHIIERSYSPLEGHGGKGVLQYLLLLPFFFLTIFVSFFPWSLFLPRMISDFRRPEARAGVASYLIGGILLTFLVFTLFATKLPHYTLPAFPLLSILFAGWIGEERFPIRWAAGMAALAFIVSLGLPALSANYFPVARLVRECANSLKPEMEMATVDFQEPSAVWYFRSFLHGWLTPISRDDIPAFMAKPGPRCCLLTKAVAETMKADPSWKELTSDGVNLATGKWVHLVLWIKETQERATPAPTNLTPL